MAKRVSEEDGDRGTGRPESPEELGALKQACSLVHAFPLRLLMPYLTCAAWFNALLGAGTAEALDGGAVEGPLAPWVCFLASSSLCAPKQEACAPMSRDSAGSSSMRKGLVRRQ
jgi:hypothetical protein